MARSKRCRIKSINTLKSKNFYERKMESMDKKTIDKVLAILSKHGVKEEVISEVETELSDKAPEDNPAPAEEEVKEPTPDLPPVEGKGDVPPVSKPEPAEGDGEPEAESTTPSDVPAEPEGDVPPADVPPVEPEADSALPEGATEVDLSGELPPVDEPAPAEPAEPLAPVVPDERDAKIEEQAKTIDALKRRLDSMEEALRKGGILSDEKPSEESYGVDDPTHISDNRDDDELLDSVIAEINKKH